MADLTRDEAIRYAPILMGMANVLGVDRFSRWCPYAPNSDTQRAFIDATEFEVLYGGEAGGGKTFALIMAALQYVDEPGYAALILRRTYKEMHQPQAPKSIADEWLHNTGAIWNHEKQAWIFPSGASLSFGYCDSPQDKFRYAGAEYQFIGFDEVTAWPDSYYSFLLSRLRKKTSSKVPLRARSTANPGGIGHAWVKERFVTNGKGKRGRFIASKRSDNIDLDKSYELSLQAIGDPILRAQLLEGRWIQGGGLVYRFDPERNLVDRAPQDLSRFILGIDYGVKDDCAFTVLGWKYHERIVYTIESKRYRDMIPDTAAEVTRELEQRWSFDRIVGDVSGLGKAFAEEARRRFAVPVEPAEKRNKRGYQQLMNGALERKELMIVADGCEELIDEWSRLPWKLDMTAEADGFDNHCADSCLYGWRAATAFAEEPKPVSIAAEDDPLEQQLLAELERKQRMPWYERDWQT